MKKKSPWEQPHLSSAYQLGQQLVDQALEHRTRRVREVHREGHVSGGELHFREVEIEVEETVGQSRPRSADEEPRKSWLDRLLGG